MDRLRFSYLNSEAFLISHQDFQRAGHAARINILRLFVIYIMRSSVGLRVPPLGLLCKEGFFGFHDNGSRIGLVCAGEVRVLNYLDSIRETCISSTTGFRAGQASESHYVIHTFSSILVDALGHWLGFLALGDREHAIWGDGQSRVLFASSNFTVLSSHLVPWDGHGNVGAFYLSVYILRGMSGSGDGIIWDGGGSQ
ncbi:hypothetical protein K469DRAFT_264925 [Zopfia rhizophila CBS 207.26]|uniref:Uncharacterized protein n=1 Tax=Zopfia rhizophila CBS 207.26 TaxID=1314779 RepID=A0A6A6DS94_9PEZI|nr:hypothetical protein K469DRAFT_264925 [Zopfia rhizophila CBS 207.26]